MPKKKPILPPDAPRTCTKCGEFKPVDEFRRSRSYPSGRTPDCNVCIRKYVNWYQNTPTGKIKLREAGLKYRYGITTEQYNALFLKQNSVCAICKVFPDYRHQKGALLSLAVDHCHETGKVRGLLCQSCNRGIGFLKTIQNTKSAVAYLEEQNISAVC